MFLNIEECVLFEEKPVAQDLIKLIPEGKEYLYWIQTTENKQPFPDIIKWPIQSESLGDNCYLVRTFDKLDNTTVIGI